VSQITTGTISLHPEPVDIVALVRDVTEQARARAVASDRRLVLQLPDGPVWVHADPRRLTQALGGLIVNAEKATDPGDEICVSLITDASKDEVEVAVRDTGCGIDPSRVESLFEPFVERSRANDKLPGGLGLGLSLFKGIVEAHGGRVRGTSAGPGHGAAFAFRLPLRPPPEDGDRSTAGGVVGSEEPVPARRVLLVDDHRDSLVGLTELLALDGHAVEATDDSRSVLDTARRHRPDVVICDIGMPGIDGYDVARALREDPATASATIIALTGFADEVAVSASYAAGFDHHLTKPVDSAKLRELLAKTHGHGARETKPI
jgi:CheY-like chemotaxis protein